MSLLDLALRWVKGCKNYEVEGITFIVGPKIT